LTDRARLEAFLEFSRTLTAFSVYELCGTGQAEAYLGTLTDVAGTPAVDELLAAYARALEDAGGEERLFERALRRELLSDDKLGPLARNVIKMWYVGIWFELPTAWRERFGTRTADGTHTVSAVAYTEALLWPAIGANPAGAKAPGYGSWVGPPRIPADSL
jgi:hypothetical protein